MIYLNDLKKEYFQIEDEVDRAIKKVLESGYYILGREVSLFEEKFSQYMGCEYCVGVGNGTEAINLSLRATGINDGDEVITSCLTAYPTIAGIREAGGVPILVDIDPNTCLINPLLIKDKITSKTKFIIPVHLYGQCADMDKIIKIAEEYNLKIIEDCAQAVGAEYKNIKAGKFGIAAAFSFYPTKNLGAYGDGGAVITDDKDIYNKLIMLRNYGQKDRYHHEINGINSRLDEIQAAILRIKLNHIDKILFRKREIAKIYDSKIKIRKVREQAYNKHVYHQYVIFSAERNMLQDYLYKNDIQTLIHYPIPIYKQKALNYTDNNFPATDKATSEILSIPAGPTLTGEEINYIINKINNFKK
jgi:dTDP-4-amino-4,6-dideoxygalactose transaminase